jgi:hypothetical protein
LISDKDMRNEHLGERWFLMDHVDNSRFFQPDDEESVIVATVVKRCACPTRHPSPKNSFVPRIATTASSPCSETTVTFTLPFWM